MMVTLAPTHTSLSFGIEPSGRGINICIKIRGTLCTKVWRWRMWGRRQSPRSPLLAGCWGVPAQGGVGPERIGTPARMPAIAGLQLQARES
jgi:hypothetical protein